MNRNEMCCTPNVWQCCFVALCDLEYARVLRHMQNLTDAVIRVYSR
jgi:hypothetical protein